MASLYKRNGTYYVKFYEDGKRVRRSTETSLLADARKIKEQIERQLALGKFQVEKKDAETAVFWEEYKGWAKNHKRPATLAAEAIFWKQFTDFALPRTLGSVTAHDVERFKAKRVADGLKPKSINDALGALRTVYNHAIKLGHFNGRNPFTGIQRLKVPKNPPKFLTKEQIEAVLNAAAKRGRNIHLVFALGIYAGLRKNEIMNARWDAGWNVLEEENGSGTLTSTLVGRLADIAGTNPSTGTTRYVLPDHLGSLRALYASDKTLLGSDEYTPYGEDYAQSGATATRKFTGHDWDSATGLYYAPFRYYGPSLGRWMSRDPVIASGTGNLYPYVLANPLLYNDPMGNEPVTATMTLAVGATYVVEGAGTAAAAVSITGLVVFVGSAVLAAAAVYGTYRLVKTGIQRWQSKSKIKEQKIFDKWEYRDGRRNLINFEKVRRLLKPPSVDAFCAALLSSISMSYQNGTLSTAVVLTNLALVLCGLEDNARPGSTGG